MEIDIKLFLKNLVKNIIGILITTVPFLLLGLVIGLIETYVK